MMPNKDFFRTSVSSLIQVRLICLLICGLMALNQNQNPQLGIIWHGSWRAPRIYFVSV